MADNSTDSPALQSEGTSNYTPVSYDIAPEDAALADSLVNLHPINDIAGPVSSDVPLKAPATFSRDMLGDTVRAQFDARWSEVPVRDRTPELEQTIIREEMENFAYATRVWGGPGPDANAYQQERFLIENEIFEAQSKLSERLSALSEIIRHDRKVDDATGEVWDEPVYRVQGDARTASEFEVSELRQRLALLQGSEGQRRLAKAKWEAVEQAKRLRDEAAIDSEAQALAKSDARAARVAERAAAYRKFEDTER